MVGGPRSRDISSIKFTANYSSSSQEIIREVSGNSPTLKILTRRQDYPTLRLRPRAGEFVLGIYPNDKEFRNRLVLTFDDGPALKGRTEKILDILKRERISATFFVCGYMLLKNGEDTLNEDPFVNPVTTELDPEKVQLLRRMVKEGHLLGNHSWDHSHFDRPGITSYAIRDNLEKTQIAVDRALGYHYELTLVRTPYGTGTKGQVNADNIQEALRQGNNYFIYWQDSFNKKDHLLVKNKYFRPLFLSSTLQGIKESHGGVILLHDIHETTADLLEELIGEIRKLRNEQGSFRFIPLDDLLRLKYSDL